MEDLLSQLNINFEENFSIVNFVINIIICGLLLFFLKIIYTRFGNALSNREELGKVLILVGITTFIIISIVKSSLALSLGLVGALSIVRFRTAIKEPEELGYFFIAISIGLGLGANQLLPTAIGFLFLIVIIVLLGKRNLKSSLTQNLLIVLKNDTSRESSIMDEVSAIIIKNSKQVDVKRVKYSDTEINFNFLVNLSSMENIRNIQNEINQIDSSAQITFISNNI